MNTLIKYSGFLAVLCAVDGAFAAVSTPYRGQAQGRVSIATPATTGAANAMRARIPTMTKTGTVSTSTATTSTSSSLLSQQECIEKYTECIHDTNACGMEFEECTTKQLFYAKKPQCNSVMLQCGTDGINALFGTSDTTAFADKDSDDNFVYPKDGSILGQFIEGGHIANLLDKTQCVKRVTSCLKKENVCGETFELCTSNAEFKKQKVFCESTLARCQKDGIEELFGPNMTATSNPASGSRLNVMITEGAELAAVNAVSTCYKVADQCILSTCSANPYKCIVDTELNVADIVEEINAGSATAEEKKEKISDARTSAMVNSFIRGACMDTVGGNKYCHMTVNGGRVPSASALIDEEERDNVYSDIYTSRMNAAMRAKIQEFANKFDKKAKGKCSDTIMACAMRSCGSGVGSLCYQKVFNTGSSSSDFRNSINGASTYEEIKRGCASIVNTDANCQYAATVGGKPGYKYAYNDSDTFGKLFPAASESEGLDDPLGVVERLNAALSTNYNDAAIAAMAKQCRATAVSCIKSMCGSDYTNCYRNRTDVMTNTYDTDGNANDGHGELTPTGQVRPHLAGTSGSSSFDNSMNKVGGVLDFTIVRGLCVNAIKEADVCDEHLKIQKYKNENVTNASSWGGANSVHDAWTDAVSGGYTANKVKIDGETVETGLCLVNKSKASAKCQDKTDAMECNYVDEDGCIYSVSEVVPREDYQLNMAATSLFREVLGDIELEAQAKYNAKITREQNMCVGANNGGIMGRNDMSSTYMWVKLKSKRVPKNYSTAGLKVNDFTASNDLYGSFCRARVTIQSDDPNVQKYLQQNNQNWSTAYFAVGDVFTCGSWIPQEKLEEIAKYASGQVEGTELYERNQQQKAKDERNSNWIAGLSAVAGAAGTGLLANVMQNKNILGGLLNKNVNTSSVAKQNKTFAGSCVSNANRIINTLGSHSENVITRDNADGTHTNAGMSYSLISSDLSKLNSALGRIKDANNQELSKITCCTPADQGVTGQKVDKCLDAVTVARDACQSVIDNGGEVEVGSGQDNTRRWINIGAAVVGGAGTFFAVRKLVRDSKSDKLTQAQQDAYDKFMREVGDHIYCFIGADEAGNYGDLIEISID